MVPLALWSMVALAVVGAVVIVGLRVTARPVEKERRVAIAPLTPALARGRTEVRDVPGVTWSMTCEPAHVRGDEAQDLLPTSASVDIEAWACAYADRSTAVMRLGKESLEGKTFDEAMQDGGSSGGLFGGSQASDASHPISLSGHRGYRTHIDGADGTVHSDIVVVQLDDGSLLGLMTFERDGHTPGFTESDTIEHLAGSVRFAR